MKIIIMINTNGGKNIEIINQANSLKDKFVVDVSCRLRSNDITICTRNHLNQSFQVIKLNQELQQCLNW